MTRRDGIAGSAAAALDAIGAVLLVAVLGATLLQVSARYVFSWSVPWSEELTRLLFVWMVMLAAAGTVHMRIDFFVARMGSKTRKVIRTATGLLSMAMLALMAWKSLGLIELTRHDHYAALGVSVQYVYWAALAGCITWLITIGVSLVRAPDPGP